MLRTYKSLLLAAVLVFQPVAGFAGCYADYKAKKDKPLRLHYGVVALPETNCNDKAAVTAAISNRIAKEKWTLLNVLGVFDESGLNDRRDSAGDFFLRY